MAVRIVVGVNWGDEGKGRMVDYFRTRLNNWWESLSTIFPLARNVEPLSFDKFSAQYSIIH